MGTYRAWAAQKAGTALEPFEFDPGPLPEEDVEIAIEYGGVCHSDLSMLNNEWGQTQYPFVPGHEAVGRITAVGKQVKGLQVGQRVGVGWNVSSCMYCHFCISGDHQLCAKIQPTIIGHYGGFANLLRAHWAWAFPLPSGLDIKSAGLYFAVVSQYSAHCSIGMCSQQIA